MMADNTSRNIWDIFNDVTSDVESSKERNDDKAPEKEKTIKTDALKQDVSKEVVREKQVEDDEAIITSEVIPRKKKKHKRKKSQEASKDEALSRQQTTTDIAESQESKNLSIIPSLSKLKDKLNFSLLTSIKTEPSDCSSASSTCGSVKAAGDKLDSSKDTAETPATVVTEIEDVDDIPQPPDDTVTEEDEVLEKSNEDIEQDKPISDIADESAVDDISSTSVDIKTKSSKGKVKDKTPSKGGVKGELDSPPTESDIDKSVKAKDSSDQDKTPSKSEPPKERKSSRKKKQKKPFVFDEDTKQDSSKDGTTGGKGVKKDNKGLVKGKQGSKGLQKNKKEEATDVSGAAEEKETDKVKKGKRRRRWKRQSVDENVDTETLQHIARSIKKELNASDLSGVSDSDEDGLDQSFTYKDGSPRKRLLLSKSRDYVEVVNEEEEKKRRSKKYREKLERELANIRRLLAIKGKGYSRDSPILIDSDEERRREEQLKEKEKKEKEEKEKKKKKPKAKKPVIKKELNLDSSDSSDLEIFDISFGSGVKEEPIDIKTEIKTEKEEDIIEEADKAEEKNKVELDPSIVPIEVDEDNKSERSLFEALGELTPPSTVSETTKEEDQETPSTSTGSSNAALEKQPVTSTQKASVKSGKNKSKGQASVQSSGKASTKPKRLCKKVVREDFLYTGSVGKPKAAKSDVKEELVESESGNISDIKVETDLSGNTSNSDSKDTDNTATNSQQKGQSEKDIKTSPIAEITPKPRRKLKKIKRDDFHYESVVKTGSKRSHSSSPEKETTKIAKKASPTKSIKAPDALAEALDSIESSEESEIRNTSKTPDKVQSDKSEKLIEEEKIVKADSSPDEKDTKEKSSPKEESESPSSRPSRTLKKVIRADFHYDSLVPVKRPNRRSGDLKSPEREAKETDKEVEKVKSDSPTEEVKTGVKESESSAVSSVGDSTASGEHNTTAKEKKPKNLLKRRQAEVSDIESIVKKLAEKDRTKAAKGIESVVHSLISKKEKGKGVQKEVTLTEKPNITDSSEKVVDKAKCAGSIDEVISAKPSEESTESQSSLPEKPKNTTTEEQVQSTKSKSKSEGSEQEQVAKAILGELERLKSSEDCSTDKLDVDQDKESSSSGKIEEKPTTTIVDAKVTKSLDNKDTSTAESETKDTTSQNNEKKCSSVSNPEVPVASKADCKEDTDKMLAPNNPLIVPEVRSASVHNQTPPQSPYTQNQHVASSLFSKQTTAASTTGTPGSSPSATSSVVRVVEQGSPRKHSNLVMAAASSAQSHTSGTEDMPLDLSCGKKKDKDEDDAPLDLSVKKPKSPEKKKCVPSSSSHTSFTDTPPREPSKAVGRVAPFQSSPGILESRNPEPHRQISPVRPHIRGKPVDDNYQTNDSEIHKAPKDFLPSDIMKSTAILNIKKALEAVRKEMISSREATRHMDGLEQDNSSTPGMRQRDFPFSSLSQTSSVSKAMRNLSSVNHSIQSPIGISSPIVIEPENVFEEPLENAGIPSFTMLHDKPVLTAPLATRDHNGNGLMAMSSPTILAAGGGGFTSVLQVPNYVPMKVDLSMKSLKKTIPSSKHPKSKEKQQRNGIVNANSGMITNLDSDDTPTTKDMASLPPLVDVHPQNGLDDKFPSDKSQQDTAVSMSIDGVFDSPGVVSPEKVRNGVMPIGSTRKYVAMAKKSPQMGDSVAREPLTLTNNRTTSGTTKTSKTLIGPLIGESVGCAPKIDLKDTSAFRPSTNSESAIAASKTPYLNPTAFDVKPSKCPFRISETKYFQNAVTDNKKMVPEPPQPTNYKKKRHSTKELPQDFKNTWKEHLFNHKSTVFKMPDTLVHVPSHVKPGFKTDIPMPSTYQNNTPPPTLHQHVPETMECKKKKGKRKSGKVDDLPYLILNHNDEIEELARPPTKKKKDQENENSCMSKEVLEHVMSVIDEVAKGAPDHEKYNAKPSISFSVIRDGSRKEDKSPEVSKSAQSIADILRKGTQRSDQALLESTPLSPISSISSAVDDTSSAVLESAQQISTLKRKKKIKKQRRKPSHAKLGLLIENVTKSLATNMSDPVNKLPMLFASKDQGEMKKSPEKANLKANSKKSTQSSRKSIVASSSSSKSASLSSNGSSHVGGTTPAFTSSNSVYSPKKARSFKKHFPNQKDEDLLKKAQVSPNKKKGLLAKPVVPLKLLESWKDLSPMMRKVELKKYEDSQKQSTQRSKEFGSPSRSPKHTAGISSPKKSSPSKSPNGKSSSKSPKRARSASPKKKKSKADRRSSMLKQLENSAGYVAEKRIQKESVDLLVEPDKLDREAKKLQRYMMQFTEIEINGALKTKQERDHKRAWAQQLKKKAMNIRKPKKYHTIVCHSGFIDFQPVVLEKRTRNAKGNGSGTGYHKDGAYEQALDDEEKRLQDSRGRRQETTDIDESLTYEEDTDEYEPGVPLPKKKTRTKGKGKGKNRRSTNNNASKISFDESLPHEKPAIEIVMDDDVDDMLTLENHYGKNNSMSRMDTFILPTTRREPRGDEFDDTMSTATSTSFMSFDGKLYVPPEVKKLSVNKDTGETIMHKVARLGKEDICLWLCQTGYVNVKKTDHAGYTPLHESAASGHIHISRILLQYGLDVNAASRTDGIRPLHDAVENDDIEMARLLLSYGADPSLSTFSGKSIFNMIKSSEMKEFLQGYMTDLNGPTKPNEKENPWFLDEYPVEPDGDETEPGFHMFENVPVDEEDPDDIYMMFESSDRPPIQTYYLVIDMNVGPKNYVLLVDVLQRLKMTKYEFEELNEEIKICKLSWDQLAQQMSTYTIPVTCPAMPDPGPSRQQTVDLLPWEAEVQRLLMVEKESVGIDVIEMNTGNESLLETSDIVAGFDETEVDLCEFTTDDDEMQVDQVRRTIEMEKQKTSTKGVSKTQTRTTDYSPVTIQMVDVSSEEENTNLPGPSTTSTPHKQKHQCLTSTSMVTLSDSDSAKDTQNGCSIKIAGVCSLNTADAMKLLGSKMPFTPPKAPVITLSDSSDVEFIDEN